MSGVLFATGHHLFYQRLAGTAVSTDNFNLLGSSISRQEASVAIGTALAFVTKACLVFAISLAFIQVLWREISARNAAPTLATIDNIWSAIANLLVLFNLPLWLKYPLLLLMATAAWYVLLSFAQEMLDMYDINKSSGWYQLPPSSHQQHCQPRYCHSCPPLRICRLYQTSTSRAWFLSTSSSTRTGIQLRRSTITPVQIMPF